MRESARHASVSVVLPCFNEGARIAATIEAIRSWFDEPPEILVVDDGSTDGTTERAGAAAGPDLRVHRLPRNGGKGAALRAGIPLATGDRVLLVDADLPFDRESVLAVLRALDAADMAVGSRRHPGSRYTVPVRLFGFLYRRHLVGLAFNLTVRALLQVGFRDTQCGLKGFRREPLQAIAPSLTTDGFALDLEMFLAARALRLRIAEVPVHVRYDTAASTVRILRSAVAVAGDLLRLSARRAAGRYSAARITAAAARARRPAPLPTDTAPGPTTDLEA